MSKYSVETYEGPLMRDGREPIHALRDGLCYSQRSPHSRLVAIRLFYFFYGNLDGKRASGRGRRGRGPRTRAVHPGGVPVREVVADLSTIAQQTLTYIFASRSCGKVGVPLNLRRRCVSKFALRLP